MPKVKDGFMEVKFKNDFVAGDKRYKKLGTYIVPADMILPKHTQILQGIPADQVEEVDEDEIEKEPEKPEPKTFAELRGKDKDESTIMKERTEQLSQPKRKTVLRRKAKPSDKKE